MPTILADLPTEMHENYGFPVLAFLARWILAVQAPAE
jgi:hypothetical protein